MNDAMDRFGFEITDALCELLERALAAFKTLSYDGHYDDVFLIGVSHPELAAKELTDMLINLIKGHCSDVCEQLGVHLVTEENLTLVECVAILEGVMAIGDLSRPDIFAAMELPDTTDHREFFAEVIAQLTEVTIEETMNAVITVDQRVIDHIVNNTPFSYTENRGTEFLERFKRLNQWEMSTPVSEHLKALECFGFNLKNHLKYFVEVFNNGEYSPEDMAIMLYQLALASKCDLKHLEVEFSDIIKWFFIDDALKLKMFTAVHKLLKAYPITE